MESDSLKKENIFSLTTSSITIFSFGSEQDGVNFINKNKDVTNKDNFLIFIIILGMGAIINTAFYGHFKINNKMTKIGL